MYFLRKTELRVIILSASKKIVGTKKPGFSFDIKLEQ